MQRHIRHFQAKSAALAVLFWQTLLVVACSQGGTVIKPHVALIPSNGAQLTFEWEEPVHTEIINGKLNVCLTSKSGMLLQVNGLPMTSAEVEYTAPPQTARIVLMNTPLSGEALTCGPNADSFRLTLVKPTPKEGQAWRLLTCTAVVRQDSGATPVSVDLKVVLVEKPEGATVAPR